MFSIKMQNANNTGGVGGGGGRGGGKEEFNFVFCVLLF